MGQVGSLSSKYQVDYSQMTDAEQFHHAIEDCKNYLTNKKFDTIIATMKDDKPTFDIFKQMMGFLAGIEGYPVKAMYQFAFGFESVKED